MENSKYIAQKMADLLKLLQKLKQIDGATKIFFSHKSVFFCHSPNHQIIYGGKNLP